MLVVTRCCGRLVCPTPWVRWAPSAVNVVVSKSKQYLGIRSVGLWSQVRLAHGQQQQQQHTSLPGPQPERENVYTIPNAITAARLAMTPYLGHLILSERHGLALVLVAIAGISDVVCS